MPVSTTEEQACSEQIKRTRNRLNLTQKEFAERLGTTQSNIAKWESGKYRPSPEQFMKLSRMAAGEVEEMGFLMRAGVAESFLEGRVPKGLVPAVLVDDAMRKAESRRLTEIVASGVVESLRSELRDVPLLRDAAAAGTPREIDEKEIDDVLAFPREWLPRGGLLYGVRIKGDSMAPILLDGHIVIVDASKRKADHLVRRMVVARDDEGGSTVKWLRKMSGIYSLVPQHVSQEHETTFLKPHGDFELVGEVVMWIGHPPPTKRK